jgi:hypothetical protein
VYTEGVENMKDGRLQDQLNSDKKKKANRSQIERGKKEEEKCE